MGHGTHDLGKIADHLDVGDVAALGEMIHHQMIDHQDLNELVLFFREPQPFAYRGGQFATAVDVRCLARSDILAQIVQDEREGEQSFVGQPLVEVGERPQGCICRIRQTLKCLDAMKGMLFNRVAVIEVKLHQTSERGKLRYISF